MQLRAHPRGRHANLVVDTQRSKCPEATPEHHNVRYASTAIFMRASALLYSKGQAFTDNVPAVEMVMVTLFRPHSCGILI
jgi:hypothetical protein